METSFEVNALKQAVKHGIRVNYEKFGEVSPIVFILIDGKPRIQPIPNLFLETNEGKEKFMATLRLVCKDTSVSCAGIVIEAWARSFSSQEDHLAQLLMDGNMKVRDLKEKDDVIVMIFATPDKEEGFVYKVDEKNKKISMEEPMKAGFSEGIFSNFFELRTKNEKNEHN
jgi:hypothetical protein